MATKRNRIGDDPQTRAALLAAKWAQQQGLAPGNYWEPAVARVVLDEYAKLGGTPDLWPAVEGIFSARLGLDRAATGLDDA